MRISDGSSDVCSSDLLVDAAFAHDQRAQAAHLGVEHPDRVALRIVRTEAVRADQFGEAVGLVRGCHLARAAHLGEADLPARFGKLPRGFRPGETAADDMRSEEHTSELQSLMRSSYAVFCLKKNNRNNTKYAQGLYAILTTTLLSYDQYTHTYTN